MTPNTYSIVNELLRGSVTKEQAIAWIEEGRQHAFKNGRAAERIENGEYAEETARAFRELMGRVDDYISGEAAEEGGEYTRKHPAAWHDLKGTYARLVELYDRTGDAKRTLAIDIRFPNIRIWCRTAPDAVGIRFARDVTNEEIEAFQSAIGKAIHSQDKLPESSNGKDTCRLAGDAGSSPATGSCPLCAGLERIGGWDITKSLSCPNCTPQGRRWPGSGNYVADREIAPTEVTFANGRTVRVVDGALVVGWDEPEARQVNPVQEKKA